MSYDKIEVPEGGAKVSYDEAADELDVPDTPIIPIIHGDGIGKDVGPIAQDVLSAAAEATGHDIEWMEVYAGESAREMYDENLPEETVEAIREHRVAIKGRSRRRSVPGSAASTWRCARRLTSTRTCGRPTTWTASRHP